MKKQKWPWKFCEFVSVKLNFLPVKIWKKCARESRKSVREKNHNCVWEIYQYIQFQDQVLMIVTILIKILSKTCASEKNTNPWKKKKILPVKRNILPVKKYKNSAREKKKCAWKKQKKVCVKNTFCPWKNPKNEKKRFSRALFFSRGKKITLPNYDATRLTTATKRW